MKQTVEVTESLHNGDFPDMGIYFVYSVNASLNLSLQIRNCQRYYATAKFQILPYDRGTECRKQYQCLTCNVPMYNEHEYFDNTS